MNWQMTHSSIATLDYNGQRMYVYCGSGGVAGVSATDGHILWQTTDWTVSTATVPTPVPIGGGKILFTGGYGAGAAVLQVNGQGNAFTVSIVYKLPPEIFGSDQQTPIFYGGYIYGVKSGGELVCMDTSGKPRWTSGVRRFGLGPYLIADGLIYLLDDTGTLTMAQASPDAYKELGQIKILNGPDAWGPMALVNGLLIARDLTHMVCLDISNR
jgi:outer membrane protein assembly factor BamB